MFVESRPVLGVAYRKRESSFHQAAATRFESPKSYFWICYILTLPSTRFGEALPTNGDFQVSKQGFFFFIRYAFFLVQNGHKNVKLNLNYQLEKSRKELAAVWLHDAALVLGC